MPLRPDEELVQHARALRGIARALVGAGNADDVAQEAAVQALQRPPAQVTTMFGWLSGVVRHRAQKHHRGEWRRKRREQVAGEHTAAAEPSPSPLNAAMHRETIARLDQALLGLPQPYQDTVLLRYYEGLLPLQIAERTATPIATVKSRLARGLAMLRERLDDEDRGRGSWRAAFAVAFGMPEAGVITWTTLGILLMTSKLMVAAAAVVLVGWWLWPAGDDVRPPAMAQQSVRDDAAAAASEQGDAPVAQREEVATIPPSDAPTTVAPADGVTITGRCVDEQGSPLAGVQADARTHHVDGSTNAHVATTSGQNGVFELVLAVTADETPDLRLSAPERSPLSGQLRYSKAGDRVDLGDLTVPLARHVRGLVVDRAGAPQAGVELAIRGISDGPRQLVRFLSYESKATTDDTGSFAFDAALPPMSHYVICGNRKILEPLPPVLRLGEGDLRREMRVVVGPPPPRCHGLVVREDGTPIAGVDVQLDENRTTTGADGRFDLEPQPSLGEGSRRLGAYAPGFQLADAEWTYGDQAQLRIVLRADVAIVLRVLDERTGLPVERFAARAMNPRSWSGNDQIPMGTHAGGSCLIPVMAGDKVVLVQPEDEQLCESCFHPVTVAQDTTTECTVVLGPRRERRVVVRCGGQPAPDVMMRLIDPGAFTVNPRTEVLALDAARISGPELTRELQQVTTDREGTATLRGPKGALALWLTGDGFAPCIVQPIRLDSTETLVVEMARGATLRGRLLPTEVAQELLADVAPRTNTEVKPFGIELLDERGEKLHRFFELPFPLAADGSFAITDLPAGGWHVRVGGLHHGFVAAQVTLRAGEVLDRDLDVSSLARTTVTLRCLVEGTPVAKTFVQVRGRHAPSSLGGRYRDTNEGRTDGEGRLRFTSCPGDFDASFEWRLPSGGKVQLTPHFAVACAGEQDVVLDVQLGALDLTVLHPNGSPAAGVELWEAERNTGERWTADEHGRVRVPTIVAASLTLEAMPRSLTTTGQRSAFAELSGWKTLQNQPVVVGTVTVAPGAAAPQTLTLPSSWDR
ncbi:MAG: sigma-70 family RNA polymerase sigma factor [Planctomycetes bacterium]|nr:sigma-70 family RNA polymerase sigma factor [Planctomycetota bacterium]